MSAHFQVYEPQPIVLPKELGLRRSLAPGITEGDADIEGYDRYTFFYDVFYSRDAQSLIAIAPNFRNLWREFWWAKFYLNGRKLRPVILHGGKSSRINILMLKCPTLRRDAISITDTNHRFTMAMRSGAQINIDLKADRWTPDNHFLTLVTVQKDNPLSWIEDWIMYHSVVHGVSQFVIYDNGSANIAALKGMLRRASDNLSISAVLVKWPFAWGVPRLRYMIGRGAQDGALNHAYYTVCGHYLLNMDIDEYLAGGEIRLDEYLTREQPEVLNMKRMNVPVIAGVQGHDKDATYRTSVYAHRVPLLGGGKYVVKIGKALAMEPHCAVRHVVPERVRYSIPRSLFLVIRKIVSYAHRPYMQNGAKSHPFVVYNYDVHNTGWRGKSLVQNGRISGIGETDIPLKQPDPHYDPQRHVLDDSVQQLARKYGLA